MKYGPPRSTLPAQGTPADFAAVEPGRIPEILPAPDTRRVNISLLDIQKGAVDLWLDQFASKPEEANE